NVPSPLPSRTETLLLEKFATARSRRPSPLRSAVTRDSGFAPTGYDVPAVNAAVQVAASQMSSVPLPLQSPCHMAISHASIIRFVLQSKPDSSHESGTPFVLQSA